MRMPQQRMARTSGEDLQKRGKCLPLRQLNRARKTDAPKGKKVRRMARNAKNSNYACEFAHRLSQVGKPRIKARCGAAAPAGTALVASPQSRRRLRLDEARELLRSARPGTTVSSLAMDCGFTHLGRFSAAYSEAFGETPVETLRHTQSHSASTVLLPSGRSKLFR